MPRTLPRRELDIADHVTHKIFRHHHFHRHDRFQQNRIRFACGLLESHGAGDLKSDFRRIDIVVATVEQRHLHIDYRIARQRAVFRRFLNALFNRWNIFARNRAALDGIDKLESSARVLGLKLDPNVAVLTATAGLADESSLLLDRFRIVSLYAT